VNTWFPRRLPTTGRLPAPPNGPLRAGVFTGGRRGHQGYHYSTRFTAPATPKGPIAVTCYIRKAEGRDRRGVVFHGPLSAPPPVIVAMKPAHYYRRAEGRDRRGLVFHGPLPAPKPIIAAMKPAPYYRRAEGRDRRGFVWIGPLPAPIPIQPPKAVSPWRGIFLYSTVDTIFTLRSRVSTIFDMDCVVNTTFHQAAYAP
jgi:hypothetical protein